MIIDGKNVPLVGENYWVPSSPTIKSVVISVDHVDETVTLKALNVLNEVAATSAEYVVKFSELAGVIPARKLPGYQ